MTINIQLRSIKGSPLTASEVDANFSAVRDSINDLQINSGVSTFNNRKGDIALTSADISSALGYTPSAVSLPQLVAGKYLTSDGTTVSWGDAIPSASSNIQVASLGVGTPASGVTGEIRATNNITSSYSDIRLKTITGVITDALAKVTSLTGFVYVPNAAAAQHGIGANVDVGVSAQAVQQILPEAVSPAPFDTAEDGSSKTGEHYLTVRYERLVPLLIEAIKELSAKIDNLYGENKK